MSPRLGPPWPPPRSCPKDRTRCRPSRPTPCFRTTTTTSSARPTRCNSTCWTSASRRWWLRTPASRSSAPSKSVRRSPALPPDTGMRQGCRPADPRCSAMDPAATGPGREVTIKGPQLTGSVVLDTAIGLAVVFFAASSIRTGVLEWISNKLNKRGEYLLRGLREMLDLPPATPDDPRSQGDVPVAGQAPDLMTRGSRRAALQELSVQGKTLRDRLSAAQPGATVSAGAPLADLVLAHPLVAVLHRPARPGTAGGDMHLASYLSGRTFAASLIDLLVPNGAGRTTLGELETQLTKLAPGVPARAVLMNLDTLGAGYALYHDQPVRAAAVAQAVADQACPPATAPGRDACLGNQKGVLDRLPLPIGWGLSAAGSACATYNQTSGCGADPRRWFPFLWHNSTRHGLVGIGGKVLGWLLTAAAVSLGAPFWFDALGKLGSLRTAGRRPGETAPFVPPPR